MTVPLGPLTYATCTVCCIGEHGRCDGYARIYGVGDTVSERKCACPCQKRRLTTVPHVG